MAVGGSSWRVILLSLLVLFATQTSTLTTNENPNHKNVRIINVQPHDVYKGERQEYVYYDDKNVFPDLPTFPPPDPDTTVNTDTSDNATTDMDSTTVSIVTPEASSTSTISVITSTGPPIQTSSTPKPPTTDKELYKRTKQTFEKIDTNLTEYSAQLALPSSTSVKQKLQPLAFRLQFEQNEEKIESVDLDSICKTGQPIELCESLQDTLGDIEAHANTFIKSPNLWSSFQLTELETQSKDLEVLLENDKLDEQLNIKEFQAYVDDTDKLLLEAVKVADDQIKDIENKETDAIIFVSVFGSIGGLMVISLISGIGFMIYKQSSLKKKKNNKTPKDKSTAKKSAKSSKTKQKKPENNDIQMERPYESAYESAYESTRPPPPRQEYPRRPAPPPRSATDLYSRPHAPKSNRYYTADEVNGRYGGGHQQGLRRY